MFIPAFVTCPTCLEPYHQTSRPARIITICGHDLCEICAEKILKTSPAAANKMTCPVCQAIYKVSGIGSKKQEVVQRILSSYFPVSLTLSSVNDRSLGTARAALDQVQRNSQHLPTRPSAQVAQAKRQGTPRSARNSLPQPPSVQVAEAGTPRSARNSPQPPSAQVAEAKRQGTPRSARNGPPQPPSVQVAEEQGTPLSRTQLSTRSSQQLPLRNNVNVPLPERPSEYLAKAKAEPSTQNPSPQRSRQGSDARTEPPSDGASSVATTAESNADSKLAKLPPATAPQVQQAPSSSPAEPNVVHQTVYAQIYIGLGPTPSLSIRSGKGFVGVLGNFLNLFGRR